jgi:hypothetical protein
MLLRKLARFLLAVGGPGSLLLACGAPPGENTGGHAESTTSTAAVGGGGAGGASSSAIASSAESSTASVSVTVGASSSSGGPPPGEDELGKSCTSDAQCGPLTCLLQSPGVIFGAGPQGGLCTKTCKNEASCPAGGICLDLGGKSYCSQKCTPGSSVPASDKCRGRKDVGCGMTNSGKSACFPTCTSDAACGGGLHCNYDTGLCDATLPSGSAMGKACIPGGANTCAGICLCTNAACTEGACSGFCVAGVPNSCGLKEGTGVCALVLTDDSGDGDRAACMGDCMCNGDCAPSLVCNGFIDVEPYGKNGACWTDLGGLKYPQCCSCSGKVCGDDGCGASCGNCAQGESCAGGGACCTSCGAKTCGPDGCGGTCGACAANEACNGQGQCQCVPSCAGKTCGADGCGGTCGLCSGTKVCNVGNCCAPNCAGKTCGSDGCGGTCGSCAGVCNNGVCCTQNLPCSNDNDCCGSYCGIITNTCASCLPLGEFCTSDAKCCSKACQNGNCVQCLSNFQLCTTSAQCCSGVCGPNGSCKP